MWRLETFFNIPGIFIFRQTVEGFIVFFTDCDQAKNLVQVDYLLLTISWISDTQSCSVYIHLIESQILH